MTISPANIPGGYVLIARKLLESELMDKPPHYLKLWVWMLGKAFWKDGSKLQRGQFHTTIDEMQEAMSYKSGFRKTTPTKEEIRSAYSHFKEAAMVITTKATRGMVITICNYDAYQNPESYGPHSKVARNGDAMEATMETTAEPTHGVAVSHRNCSIYQNPESDGPHDGPHDGDTTDPTGQMKKNKQLKPEPLLSDFFEKLWRAYPRKDGRKEAERHFHATVKNDSDKERINLALGAYLDHIERESTPQKYIKTGKVWFNNWHDWIPQEESDAA